MKLRVITRGWPWQPVCNHWSTFLDKTIGERWGWNPFKVKGMGRFGGGWAFCFGITADEKLQEVIINLGIGSIRIQRLSKGEK